MCRSQNKLQVFYSYIATIWNLIFYPLNALPFNYLSIFFLIFLGMYSWITFLFAIEFYETVHCELENITLFSDP